MRIGAVTALGLVMATGWAQVDEGQVRDALVALGAESEQALQLTWTRTRGAQTEEFLTKAFWSIENGDAAGLARLEILLYRKQGETFTPLLRLTGDGRTLYRYDFERFQWSAANYAPPEVIAQDRPYPYRRRALDLLWGAGDYRIQPALRVLLEANGAATGSYRSWLPGVEAIADGDTLTLKNRAESRGITFTLSSEEDGRRLRRVSGWVNGSSTQDAWTLEWIDELPPAGAFSPYPASDVPGWRVLPWASRPPMPAG
jgi:hypothetical protein